MLLRTALPAIQSRANDLREEIDVLAEARKEIARQLIALQHATQDRAVNRKELDEVIARKSALLSQTKSERTRVKRRIKRLALEARSLKELFARLEAERPPPPPPVPAQPDPNSNVTSAPPQKPVETARLVLPRPETLRPFPEGGTITLPARGNIDQRYGENNRYGNTAKGITIQTRPAAQIVAPYDGKVVFAGPFRSYRQILIIEHTDGYHTLLAGMVRVDTAVGQWLLAGEPVGVMARSKNAVPRLYFELRRKGQPVNPLPWFVEYRKRVRG
jgi:septal ring factor EnvC (AmiA/AmiB activator)